MGRLRRARSIAAVLALLTLSFAPNLSAADPASPVIAIIDSGIDATHSEFAPGQVVAWRDFVNGAATPYDDYQAGAIRGHGTATAARAAGATTGAFPGASLAVAKVTDASGAFVSWSTVADAVRWAVDDGGASLVGISLWAPAPQPAAARALEAAFTHARENGVLIVVMAGNGGELARAAGISAPSPITASVLTGASSASALVVGAAYADGARAEFSQLDPELLAEGGAVRVAQAGGGFTYASGASYSAPWVAGFAARLLADGAPREIEWLKWVILHTARDDPDVLYAEEGYGFLDANALPGARAVARGIAPIPDADERDTCHAASTAARAAYSGGAPTGLTRP